MPIAQVKSYVSIKPPMDELLITTDAHFHITGITDNLLRISGKDKNTLMGVHISKFLKTSSASGNSLIPASFSASVTGTFHVQALIPAEDGNMIPANWLVTPVEQDGPQRSTAFSWLGCESDAADEVSKETPGNEWNLIDNVSDSIIATDMRAKILTWNKAAEELYGLSASETLGRPIGEVVEYEYVDDSRDEAREVLLKSGKWQGEVIYRRKDGALFNIFSSVSLMKDSNGKPYGMVAVNRNITRRKEADAELSRKEKLLSAIANASNLLLARQDYFKVMEECLASITKAANADRASLLQYLFD